MSGTTPTCQIHKKYQGIECDENPLKAILTAPAYYTLR